MAPEIPKPWPCPVEPFPLEDGTYDYDGMPLPCGGNFLWHR